MASIKGQVFNVIDSNFNPGQDKRNDKFDDNMGKEKIYSSSERDNLIQVGMELEAFSKVTFDVKQIKDITYNMAREFMKSKISTCNQTTLDNFSSRLNKIERLVNQTYKSSNVDWSNIKVQSTIGQDKLRNIPMGIGDFEKLIAYAKDNGLTSKGILGAQLAGAFGLRVSEVCKLQVRDIDLVNMKIHIHESKGRVK